MLMNNALTTEGRPNEHEQNAGPAGLRVAIISDFLEEQWPSMDLVADMLTESLRAQPAEAIVPHNCGRPCAGGLAERP